MKNFLPASGETPIMEKITSSLSPEEVFACFSSAEKASFLNSSMEGDAARYSFIGLEPFFSMQSRGSLLDITILGQKLSVFGSPIKVLKSAIGAYKVSNPTPFPFVAGGIGYLSYEAKNLLEGLPDPPFDDVGVPDVSFVFYRCILIFDKKSPGEFYASVLDLSPDGAGEARAMISRIKKILNGPEGFKEISRVRLCGRASSRERVPGGGKSNFSKGGYLKAVEKILAHIKDGDIYQACLSQRFKARWGDSPYSLYLRLNDLNPSPFGAYINSGDIKIISSSPELFLRRRGNVIETRPMKGTRPALSSSAEDEQARAELESSAKDISELLMIVDLERNDIGKIAVPGSVRVEECRRIERHPTVFQAISVIKADVEEVVDNVDIIEAAFPGGSITGCPKIRAMQIINDIESCCRGVYTGSIGYLSFHGTMDLNIAIRTMTLKGSDVYFHAGGGIVADSDPEEEYRETLVKARALMRAIGE
jgi:para-aminobenzoate synthetase component I